MRSGLRSGLRSGNEVETTGAVGFRSATLRIVMECRTLTLALTLAVVSSSATARAEDTADADDPLVAARRAAAEGDSARAIRLATVAIQQNPALAEAYYVRGRENFRAGQMKASVADFDRYVKHRPRLASRQWERGIACYYAGQYEEGAKQFELYQTYHDNDVENSVWRYLCMARFAGVDKARKAMLPIKNDTRIPMMEIYRLYHGDLEPDDVLKAVERDSPTASVREGRMFYARLYLGLYYEVHGKSQAARKYILSASNDHRDTRTINRYMWDVARIHAEQLVRKDSEKEKRN